MLMLTLNMQFVYCGKKATLSIGNVKPVGDMPEGSIVCNVEEVSCVVSPSRYFSTVANAQRSTVHHNPGDHVCCLAQKAGDRGSLARASGDYVIVVAHNTDTGVTRVKLPSGAKKVQPANLSMPACPAAALSSFFDRRISHAWRLQWK